jgi:hypothetical protein
MKWEDEVSRAYAKGTAPDKRKRVALEKQPMIKKRDVKIFPSKSSWDFESGKPSFYSQTILHNLNIPVGTSVYGVDPGMNDVVSCARQSWLKPRSCCDKKRNTQPPIKSKSLSSREFYSRIRTGKKTPVPEGLSECSLKEIDPDVYLERMKQYKTYAPKLFTQWGTSKHRKESFRRSKKKNKLYDTIVEELFPDKDSVIFMGNGNIQSTMKGTSTSPLGKIIKQIIKKRRLVFVREAYTTKRCSWCQKKDVDTRSLDDNEKGMRLTESGKVYFPQIHGLRQCPNCARTWNRDFNAARNIFFNACSFVATGKHCDYLSRHESVSDENSTSHTCGSFVKTTSSKNRSTPVPF